MSIISVKKYCVKGYRRISHRKGYGVHSPFVYTLITRIIEEKAEYYAYEEIKRKISEVKQATGSKQKSEMMPLKTAKLLFRIINRFKPATVLECGTSFGISTAAITLAAPRAAVSITEADEARRKHVSVNENVWLYGGPYAETLPAIFGAGEGPDFIYIRKHASAEEYDSVFAAISPYISDNTFILAEGMHRTEKVYRLFCKLARHEKIKVFMDMYDTAMFIASPKLNKERYKESF